MPNAGSSAGRTGRCSSAGSRRSCARSSRSPPASSRCRSSGTPCSPSRARRSGASRSPVRASRPERTGRTSTTRSATSTTSLRSRSSAAVGWLGWRYLKKRRAAASPRSRFGRLRNLEASGATLARVTQPIPLVDVKAQYAPLIPELEERFSAVLESGRFIFGPEVEAFEHEAAAFLGVPHAIGVANGTDALVLALEALGIGRGDEVICPSFTFYATAEAIARVGATPVFADIDPATLNLDPEDVAARITERTKAIMPVHLFGRPRRLAELAALGLPLIEDAAQAFGADGRRADRRLLDLQLLPDEEPLRARRRRARHVPRRRGRGAGPDAALPRLARQEDLRARRDELAPRRRAGGDAARLPAAALRAGTTRGARLRRATRSSASASSSSCRSTSPVTSTTCTSSARPAASEIAAALGEAGIACASYYVTPLTSSRRCRTSASPKARSPRRSAQRPRTSRSRCGAGSTREQQERVVDAVRSVAGVPA